MLTDTPHNYSSSAVFGGALVAVGGEPFQSTIHMYIPLTQSLVPVGKMPLGLEDTLTITLPTGELLEQKVTIVSIKNIHRMFIKPNYINYSFHNYLCLLCIFLMVVTSMSCISLH